MKSKEQIIKNLLSIQRLCESFNLGTEPIADAIVFLHEAKLPSCNELQGVKPSIHVTASYYKHLRTGILSVAPTHCQAIDAMLKCNPSFATDPLEAGYVYSDGSYKQIMKYTEPMPTDTITEL